DQLRRRTVEATDTRTMYGNMWKIGGRKVRDVKLSKVFPSVTSDLPFRSSDPWTWERPHTQFIRDMFRTPRLTSEHRPRPPVPRRCGGPVPQTAHRIRRRTAHMSNNQNRGMDRQHKAATGGAGPIK